MRTDIVVVVGTVGAGKSTLLNRIIRREYFNAGQSTDGRGLTTEFARYEFKGVIYCDTPGLNDWDNQRAASQIRQALQQDGTYRIIFVLAIEAGRVPFTEIQAMLTVMKAIDTPNMRVSVVVNKVTEELMPSWETSQQNALAIVSKISGNATTNRHPNACCKLTTDRVKVVAWDDAIHSGADSLKPLPQDFLDWMDKAPRVSIGRALVRTVDVRRDDELAQQLEQVTISSEQGRARGQQELSRMQSRLRTARRAADQAEHSMLQARRAQTQAEIGLLEESGVARREHVRFLEVVHEIMDDLFDVRSIR